MTAAPNFQEGRFDPPHFHAHPGDRENDRAAALGGRPALLGPPGRRRGRRPRPSPRGAARRGRRLAPEPRRPGLFRAAPAGRHGVAHLPRVPRRDRVPRHRDHRARPRARPGHDGRPLRRPHGEDLRARPEPGRVPARRAGLQGARHLQREILRPALPGALLRGAAAAGGRRPALHPQGAGVQRRAEGLRAPPGDGARGAGRGGRVHGRPPVGALPALARRPRARDPARLQRPGHDQPRAAPGRGLQPQHGGDAVRRRPHGARRGDPRQPVPGLPGARGRADGRRWRQPARVESRATGRPARSEAPPPRSP